MMNRLYMIILAFVWSSVSTMASSDMIFHNYTTSNGLPDMGIRSISQDLHGSIWVRTSEGICMFDGESFITPEIFQQEPFSSASGQSICIDSFNMLWIDTKSGLLNYNLDTGATRLFEDMRTSAILCDGDGVIWAVSSRGLLYYTFDTDEWRSVSDFSPVDVCINSSGELCATATDGCIYVKRNGISDFIRIRVLSEDTLGSGLSLVKITSCDERRILYTTSDNSSYYLDIYTGRTGKFFDGHIDGHDAILSDILARNPHEFWIITDNGLFVYSEIDRECRRYMNNKADPYSLASSKLRSIFKDRQERIWIGTFYDGLSQFIDSGENVRIYRIRPDNPQHSLSGRTVRAICDGEDGVVYAATEDGYLEKIFPDGSIVSFGSNDEDTFKNNTYQSLAFIEGNIYAADLGGGLSVYDAQSLKLLKKYNVGSNYCAKIIYTSRKEILVGTSDGLYRLDRKSDAFVPINSIHPNFVYTMCEDAYGNIWVGVFRHGIYVLSPTDFDAQLLEITDCPDVNTKNISDLYEDKDGRILAASGADGLLIFQPETVNRWKVSCTQITKNDGLPTNKCSAVTQDRSGRIWLSTINGIVSIENDKVINMTIYKPISSYFCSGSVLNSDNGMIYMGSSDGMVAFNPYVLIERKHKLYLADIVKVRNNTVTPVTEEGHSSFTTRSIRFKSSETSSLTIRLICFKADVNEVARYQYSLKGKGNDIVNISSEKQITYANLTPGRYVFTAKVNQDNSPDASSSLAIRVVPPFYATLAAKLFYLLILIGIAYYFVYTKITIIRKDKERAIEILESYKEKEVYESKIDFFTNISHEIRTPLTLIKVPLDKILESKTYLPEAEYDIQSIKRSTDRLLDMTEQILDFRKMENGSASLTYSYTDLTRLLRDACSQIEILAKEYSVSLNVVIPDVPVSIMCASGSIDKIISNLLMNAVKYCKSKITVILEEVDENKVRISVISDGEPITQEERESIFEPFYQSGKTRARLTMTEGVGLGLSFARSLANLHNGTLLLDPSYKDGNSFVLELPKGQSPDGVVEEDEDLCPPEDCGIGKYSILVVEDDTSLNDYIRNSLSDEYAVYQAYNGKQALSVLSENNISLIVCDIMMPEMTGCEIVEVVKNTLRFSHIPIILLTAVTDYNVQLESLHSGADGYITKPFSMQILRATIFNKLRSREILYERFKTSPYSQLENNTSSKDDDFMKKLYEYVMMNISKRDFSVLDLAENMNTSRSTLYRKVRANSGMNINEYIRLCRLKKAAELLSTQKYQIKEVAYMVGFTTMSYFTKSFQKQFNISPSSLLKKN